MVVLLLLKKLSEGFSKFFWTERPFCQKTLIFFGASLVGICLFIFALRGVMALLIILHARILNLYAILSKLYNWLLSAPWRFLALIAKIIEQIIEFLREINWY